MGKISVGKNHSFGYYNMQQKIIHVNILRLLTKTIFGFLINLLLV